MLSIDPKNTSVKDFHGLMLGAVAPRPIAFASTVDEEGNVNLSPYSFFNCFGANPPIMIFSPARRVRDNTIKHTLENASVTKECVINIVNYAIVQQMSLSSTEYDKGVDEFVKAGLTKLDSEIVAPPRVAESPAQFECVVKEIVETGQEGGAGNLIICEVVRAHFKDEILDEHGKVDPQKLDAVARMGGNWYSRAKDGLFTVPKPLSTQGIGVDSLPDEVRNSKVLTGNDLGILGNLESLPSEDEISTMPAGDTQAGFAKAKKQLSTEEKHKKAKELISLSKADEALKLLMT